MKEAAVTAHMKTSNQQGNFLPTLQTLTSHSLALSMEVLVNEG